MDAFSYITGTSAILRERGDKMGQAKRELEEREQKEAMRRAILKRKGYTFCEICDQEFISKYGSFLCDDCWEHKTRD